MKVAEKLLAGITGDAAVNQVIVGAFWTAVVLETTPLRCGLASTLAGSHRGHHGRFPVANAGKLLASTARQLAQGLLSSSPLEAGIGMAALNALLDIDERACQERNAEEYILENGSGRRVAIVGHFPFVDRIRAKSRECWVLELEPGPGDEPAVRAGEILPKADVVALSGTTLINHTFDSLIEWCRPDAFVVLLGASTPLSPLLFEYGVDAISGTRVCDVEAVLRAVTEGAGFRQIPGKKLLTLTKEKHDSRRQ